MKLGKFLKHIDGVGLDVILWVGENGKNNNDKPDYEGKIWDVPGRFLKLKMVKADEDGFDGIRIYSEKNENGITNDYLIIALKEK